jgi:response regulator RpfG family c-di-GMP phosphodiesterase
MSVSRERRRAWRDRPGICERILVVDGDEGAADATGLALLSNGYDVGIATTARRARAMLDEEQFELVLCEVRLPGECGLGLVQELHRTRPDVAVVVTTEVDDVAVAEEALDAGALDYVVKPARPNHLLVTIACALRRRHELLRSSVALERASSEIVRQGRLLEAAQLDAVERLARAVELRDDHLRGHHGRVAQATGQLARTIGMPDAQSDLIAAAGLLHDVGKIGIPDSILTKPGPLTGTEQRIVQCHTTIGHALLAGSCHPVLKTAAEIALHHHERLDGSGYPHGLRGTAIPLEARMVAIADTFDALTSERPYRVARPAEDALAVIHASAGELFDAELVDAFTTVIAGGSDVGQRDVQGTWHAVELERVDQQPRVAHLAAAAAAHEPAELLLQRPAPPGGLLLQRAERHQIALDG